MKTHKTIDLAMQAVHLAFAGQQRMGGQAPAATHSLRVGLSLLAYGYSPETAVGGFFHDLLEDTNINKEYILETFGSDVLELVQCCTLDKTLKLKSVDEAEKELEYRVSQLAVVRKFRGPLRIKCADALDNLRTIEDLTSRERRQKMLERCLGYLQLGVGLLIVNDASDRALLEDLYTALVRAHRQNDWNITRILGLEDPLPEGHVDMDAESEKYVQKELRIFRQKPNGTPRSLEDALGL